MSLPLILDDEKLKEDLFKLPKDALALLFSQTETCISDYKLFKVLEEKLKALEPMSPEKKNKNLITLATDNDKIGGSVLSLSQINCELDSDQPFLS